MKTIIKGLTLILLSISTIFAVTWDDCIDKYEKAKKFSDNTQLMYIYLKSTKMCLTKFKEKLKLNPDPEFTIQAMSNNIEKLESYIEKTLPTYKFPNNTLQQVPRYLDENSNLVYNQEYQYFKKFKQCNGVHAEDKIYTAKHCNIENSKNLHFDLSVLPAKSLSNLKVGQLDLNKKGTFKYYSMSKLGMFFGTLLKEDNCRFYKEKNIPKGINTTLDLADLEKEFEIRSSCLAIPSNSGGGVFQDGKLVGIISKTVFNKKQFLYSIIEPVFPIEN